MQIRLEKAQARQEALRLARDELRREHDFIERLLAVMPSILIAVDGKQDIMLWNNAAENTFGLSREAVAGSPFSELAVDWDWAEVNRSMAALQRQHACAIEYLKFRRRDGTDGMLDLTINAVIEDGQFNGFLLIGTDITERLQLKNQLLLGQKLEAMGELAAGIAHEINTPMQYIGDNVRFLQEGFGDMLQLLGDYHRVIQEIATSQQMPEHCVADIQQAEQDADIDFLRKEVPLAVRQTLEGVAQVSNIVGAMNELSHPGTGQKVPIDINKAIENTVVVSRHEWKYIADLEMTLDPDLPLVHGLPEISQVFLNIIVNAAQAIAAAHAKNDQSKGSIHIITSCSHDMVEICINDSGPGIAAAQQHKIFDPFFTTKAQGKGTGQGLAISHQIVCNRLGGRLFVESEPGHGASFIIQLPVGRKKL